MAERPSSGNIHASTRSTGSTPAMWKNRAANGADTQRRTPSSKPNSTEAENAASRWRRSSTGRWTIAGARPSCEKMAEKPTTTSAAPTMPKSAGESSRARIASTSRRRPAYTTLPPPIHTNPPSVW